MSENTPKFIPLFIIAPGSMSKRDIRRAEKYCGICVVENKSPETLRFVDPPITHDVDAQARAAMTMFRWIVDTDRMTFAKADIIQWFVKMILEEQKLKPVAQVKKS